MTDDMNLNVKDFDDLFGSAIKEINCSSFWNDLSLQQKEEIQTKALEKLPEDYQCTVREFVSSGQSQFKLCVATENISVENLDGWLSEFQETNDITLKVKVKKKPTKGYLVQNYYIVRGILSIV